MPQDELIRPVDRIIGRARGYRLKFSAVLLCRLLPLIRTYRNRWPSSVSGIRRRSSKCVIAHKSERGEGVSAARCIFMHPQHREIKFTHFIGPIKQAHISCNGTLRMQVAEGRNERGTGPEAIRASPWSPPLFAYTNWIAFIKTSVANVSNGFINDSTATQKFCTAHISSRTTPRHSRILDCSKTRKSLSLYLFIRFRLYEIRHAE